MWPVVFAVVAAVIQLLMFRLLLNRRREDERAEGWRSSLVWTHFVLFFVLMGMAVMRTVEWVF